MTPYRRDKFGDTYTHLGGERLWDWLHRSDVFMIMETACYLRRPAIEALSPHLRESFQDSLKSLKFRQMTGHMVRQVMENRGFSLDRANVRIRSCENAFGWGAVYKKPLTMAA